MVPQTFKLSSTLLSCGIPSLLSEYLVWFESEELTSFFLMKGRNGRSFNVPERALPLKSAPAPLVPPATYLCILVPYSMPLQSPDQPRSLQ